MNYGIEFWRFIFTCIVCLLHFETVYLGGGNNIFASGYLGVEFFFILSGFFMMKHALHHDDTAIRYITDRIKRLYPPIIIAYCILIINFSIQSKWNVFEIIDEVYAHIWEFLLLTSTGITWEFWNFATWYISALLIVSYFIYWLIKKDEKCFSEFIAPLLIFAIYSWYAIQGKGLDYHVHWERICTSAISRAIGGISIGCISYYVNNKYIPKKINKYYCSCIEIIVLILIFSNIICAEKNSYNLLVLILFPVLIVIEYNKWNKWNKFFCNYIVTLLGRISINMYLNQVFFIGLFLNIHKKSNAFLDYLLFIVCLTLFACFIEFLRYKIIKKSMKLFCTKKI